MSVLDLTRLELDVIALELLAAETAATGLPYARRGLHPWERFTDFAGIDSAVEQAASLVDRQLARIGDHVLEGILEHFTDTAKASGSPWDLLELLDSWASPASDVTMPGLADLMASVQADIAGTLKGTAQGGADGMRQEALDQGVHPAIAPEIDTGASVEVGQVTDAQARAAVQGAASRVLNVAADLAGPLAGHTGTTAGDVAATVVDGLEQASTAGRLLDARVAAEAAQGVGRKVQADNSTTPTQIYASELRDRGTCGPCAAVDGTRYRTLDEAEIDYPNLNGFADCLGRDRCRGTLVLIYDEADPSAATPGDAPGTAPAPNGDGTIGPVAPNLRDPDTGKLTRIDSLSDTELIYAVNRLDDISFTGLSDADYADRTREYDQLAAEVDRRNGEAAAQARAATDAGYERKATVIQSAADANQFADASAIASVRSSVPGAGCTLDKTRDLYEADVARMADAAEAATHGNLVSPLYAREFAAKYPGNRGTFALFAGSHATAYHYASEELLNWFADHPRYTFDQYARAMGVTNAKIEARAAAADRAEDKAKHTAEEQASTRRDRQAPGGGTGKRRVR